MDNMASGSEQGGSGDCRSNLIVNYLPQNVTDKELFSMFITIGPIESCRVMKDYKTGYSYGFGFVNYQKPEDASHAIYTLNGLQLQNKTLKVSFARPCTEEIKDTNLYITNLPRNISEDGLEMLFAKYGNIVQKNLLRDKATGMPRGIAFVRFDRKEQADLAMRNMNGYVPEGSNEALNVKIAEEHGKSKAAYYAGWQAGFNQSKGRPMRGGMQQPQQRTLNYNNQMPPMRGGFQQNYNAMRPNKANNRYNPIGIGGGYNMYSWS